VSYIQAMTIIAPAPVAAVWAATRIGDLFDGNNCNLRVEPNDYSYVTEGGNSAFSDYFNGVGYTVSPTRIGFTINVRETRDEFLQFIDALSKWSVATNYGNFQPISVIDRLRVEPVDYATGYTVRTGAIWAEDRTGTTQQGRIVCATPPVEYPSGGKYNQGFKLKFLSSSKQLIR
jgi:hypothetical protein